LLFQTNLTNVKIIHIFKDSKLLLICNC